MLPWSISEVEAGPRRVRSALPLAIEHRDAPAFARCSGLPVEWRPHLANPREQRTAYRDYEGTRPAADGRDPASVEGWKSRRHTSLALLPGHRAVDRARPGC